MTRGTGSLELAHARISARWGDRPGEDLWRRIQTTRPLAGVLGLARGSSLSGWLGTLDASSDLHGIDRQIRAHWRERVAEVAGWMPPPWQPALRACAAVADLPAWQRWAQRRPMPVWVREDPDLALLADPIELPADGPLRRFALAVRGEPGRLLEHARAAWVRLLPRYAGHRPIAVSFVPLVQRHLLAFSAPLAADGWGMRRELEQRLVLLWRRHPGEPVGAFVHLALVALEGERLRGELARRVAFPDRPLAA